MLFGTGTGNFEPPVPISPALPAQVVADMNGDGILDLIGVVNTGGYQDLEIALGNPDGSFQPPATYQIAYSYGPLPIAIGDFNEDGQMDVLANSGEFLELLLGNGDGTLLTTPIYFGNLITDTSLAVADFNGDGHLDVAAFDVNNDLQLFLGAGDGSFANPLVTYAGAAPAHLVTADFNNDGVVDLALVHQYYGTLDVLLGNGDGTFLSPITSQIDPSTNAVTVADLNLDGRTDLLLLAPTDVAGYLYVLTGDGLGEFSSSPPYIVEPNPNQVIVGDFNSDGIPDAAVLEFVPGGIITALFGVGDGSFQGPPGVTLGGADSPIALTDLNSDGNLDIVVADDTTPQIIVSLGDGHGGFGPSTVTPLSQVAGLPVVADLNGDGIPDLAIAGNTPTSTVTIMRGLGDGTFAVLNQIPLTFFANFMRVADVTGDGLPDLILTDGSDGTVVVLPGLGGGLFGNPVSSLCGQYCNYFDLADFDGDGKPDVVATAGNTAVVLLDNGDGSFGTPSGFFVSFAMGNVCVGDFDGDGHMDFAVADGIGNGIAMFYGDGTGAFQVGGEIWAGPEPGFVVPVDFNRDGRLDLATTNPSNNSISLVGNLGGRLFAAPSSFGVGISPQQLLTGDLNGDSWADFVVPGGFSPEILLLMNTACQSRRIVVSIEPSSCDTPATPFAAQPVVTVVDDGDNTAYCDSGSVGATLVPGTGSPGAVLDGTTTISASAGVATFTDLSINIAGRGYRLGFDHPATSSVQSRSLTQGLFANIVGPGQTCVGQGVTFSAGLGFDTYLWSVDGLPAGSSSSIDLNGLLAGLHTVSVAVSQDGCAASASRTLTVDDLPTQPIISAPESVAPGEMGIIASAIPAWQASYYWTITGGTLSSGQGSSTVTFDAGQAGTAIHIEVVAYSSAGCSSQPGAFMTQVDFLDVGPADPFHDFVIRVARNGVSAGCGAGNFCPGEPTLRSSMAVFLLRAKHGATYVPPPATGIFADVLSSNPFAPWIEQIYHEGITSGCSTTPFEYCPNSAVAREGMAVLLLVAEHGTGYVPPACLGVFADIACPGPFTNWVEELYNEGITGGCGTNPLIYCPGNPVTRAQMAVFLTATFNLQ